MTTSQPFCPSCGTPARRGAVFCGKCGSSVGQRSAEVSLPRPAATSEGPVVMPPPAMPGWESKTGETPAAPPKPRLSNPRFESSDRVWLVLAEPSEHEQPTATIPAEPPQRVAVGLGTPDDNLSGPFQPSQPAALSMFPRLAAPAVPLARLSRGQARPPANVVRLLVQTRVRAKGFGLTMPIAVGIVLAGACAVACVMGLIFFALLRSP